MLEISLRKLAAFVFLAFVIGILIERWVALSEPVAGMVGTVNSSAGVPLVWLLAGVLAGAGGMLFFRRVRELEVLDGARPRRFRRDRERF